MGENSSVIVGFILYLFVDFWVVRDIVEVRGFLDIVIIDGEFIYIGGFIGIYDFYVNDDNFRLIFMCDGF